MSKNYDAIIIGTGQAGPSLAVRLAEAGQQVAIIERDRFGGTCVNTGCIPSKTLIANAHVAHLVQRSAEFGVNINGSVQIDMKKVKARKDAIVQQSSQGLETWLRNTPNCTVYTGHARFTAAKTITVNEEELTAEKFFINVGGRAFAPPISGADQVEYLTNSSMMDIDFLPEHLIVIGGSYIGLEFAQMYRRFGAKVTVVERAPRLIPREDEDISAAVKTVLEQEGIVLELETECMQLAKQGEQVVVKLGCASGDREIQGSHLLLAVGRRPNTDDLGLDKAGVAVDERGFIQVDDELKTSVQDIWALGECNGKGAFTHTAYNDYEIVAENLLENANRRVSDRILAYGLYLDPPLGRVGMTEAQVRASGRKALIATRPMSRVKRAVIKGNPNGFMKVLIDANSKQILGAAIFGAEGDEVIHTFLDMMYAKAPYTVMQQAMHIHPTVSELIPTMLADLKSL